jgi:hypothetical protein
MQKLILCYHNIIRVYHIRDYMATTYTLKFFRGATHTYTCLVKEELLVTIPYFVSASHTGMKEVVEKTFKFDLPVTEMAIKQYLIYVKWRKDKYVGPNPRPVNGYNPYVSVLAEYFQDTRFTQEFFLPATKIEITEHIVRKTRATEDQVSAKHLQVLGYTPFNVAHLGQHTLTNLGFHREWDYQHTSYIYECTTVTTNHAVTIDAGCYVEEDIKKKIMDVITLAGPCDEHSFPNTVIFSDGQFTGRYFTVPKSEFAARLRLRFVRATMATITDIGSDTSVPVYYGAPPMPMTRWDFLGTPTRMFLMDAQDTLVYDLRGLNQRPHFYNIYEVGSDFPAGLPEDVVTSVCTEYVTNILATHSTSSHRKMATFASQNTTIASVIWSGVRNKDGIIVWGGCRDDVCKAFHSKHTKIDDLATLFQKNDSIAKSLEPPGYEEVIKDQELVRLEREIKALSDEVGTKRYTYQAMSTRRREIMRESDTEDGSLIARIDQLDGLEKKWYARFGDLMKKQEKKKATISLDRLKRYKGDM